MIAKCIKSEKEGRKIFYGAMISESVIALVWAAAGVAFYGSTQLLSDALANGASNVVYEISTGVLGIFGGVLAGSRRYRLPHHLGRHSVPGCVYVRSQPDLHYDGSGGLQTRSDNLVHLRRFVCRCTVRNLSDIPYPQTKDS